MKKFRLLACLMACLTVFAACGKEEEQTDLEITPTTAATEAETEETTVETTTAAETTTAETGEEILITDVTLSTEILPTESDADANNPTPIPADQPVITVPPQTEAPAPEPIVPIGDDVTFQFNGTALRVGDKASGFVAAVPAVSSETTTPSYYGNGEDINYYYDDFTIYVWNENGSYQTVGIDLTGPDVSTQKGISIGSTAKDVIAAYGTGYTEEAMDYVYLYDDCNLRFTIVEGQVHYIRYIKNM